MIVAAIPIVTPPTGASDPVLSDYGVTARVIRLGPSSTNHNEHAYHLIIAGLTRIHLPTSLRLTADWLTTLIYCAVEHPPSSTTPAHMTLEATKASAMNLIHQRSRPCLCSQHSDPRLSSRTATVRIRSHGSNTIRNSESSEVFVYFFCLFNFRKLRISEVFHFRKTPDSSGPLFPVPPDPMFSSMFVFRGLRHMFLCTVFTPSPVTPFPQYVVISLSWTPQSPPCPTLLSLGTRAQIPTEHIVITL